jgi:hypothetical protein
LHAVRQNKEWTTKSATSRQRHDIANMDSQLIQVSLYAVPALNVGDTRVGSERKHGKSHDV